MVRGVDARRWGYIVAIISILTACTKPQVHLPPHNINLADLNPHPRSELRFGGNVNLPITIWPENFNPYEPEGADSSLLYMISALLPSTNTVDSTGTLHQDPNYFPEISQHIIHGRQVIDYTINAKAHWSNGSPITWKDMYANWIALRGTDPRFLISSSEGYSDIASVSRGIDDRHVRVVMRHPYGDWRLLFTELQAAQDISTPNAFNAGMLRRFPLSAGPFRVKELDIPTQTVILERDPTWWGVPALLDTITFRMEDPQGGISPYLTHEFDSFSIGSDGSNILRAQAAPHTTMLWGLTDLIYHLQFNCAPGRITRDIKVRKAIAYAMDRNFVEKVSYSNILGTSQSISNNHIFLINHAGYRDNTRGFHYDPAYARQLLDQAGWIPERAGIRYKSGQALQLNLVASGSVGSQVKAIYNVLQANLAAVGIRLILRLIPATQIFADYIDVGNFDIAFFKWEPTLSPVADARSNFYLDPHCVIGPSSACILGANYGLGGNAQINAVIDRLGGILDESERYRELNYLDTLLWDNMSDLPLLQQPAVLAQNSRLANMGNDALGVTDWINVGWVK